MDIVVVIVVGGVCRPMDLPAIKNKRRAGPPVGDDDYHDGYHYVDDYGMWRIFICRASFVCADRAMIRLPIVSGKCINGAHPRGPEYRINPLRCERRAAAQPADGMWATYHQLKGNPRTKRAHDRPKAANAQRSTTGAPAMVNNSLCRMSRR
jgi:hypothetical protein